MSEAGRLRLRGKIAITMLPALIAVLLTCATLFAIAEPLEAHGSRVQAAIEEQAALYALQLQIERYALYLDLAAKGGSLEDARVAYGEVRGALADFAAAREIERHAMEAIEEGDQEERDPKDVQALFRDVDRTRGLTARADLERAGKQLRERDVALVGRWIEDEAREIAEVRADSVAWQSNLLVVLFGVGVVGLAMTVLAGFITYRSVHARVVALGGATRRVAEGNYELAVGAKGSDEIADLARDFDNMAKKLHEQHEELIARERQMKEFFAMLSHELRAPLNSVIGLVELVEEREQALSPRSANNLLLARRSAENMRATVDDILDLSKLEAGKLEIRASAFEPESVLRELADQARVLVGAKPIDVQLDIHAPLGELTSDATRVRQVLLNLVSNACRYTERGSIVLRSARSAHGNLEVSVADSGVGIRPEMQAAVFDAYRQDRNAAEVSGGTGLGLAIVRRLVDLLGGKVRLESEFGRGSTFSVEFADMKQG